MLDSTHESEILEQEISWQTIIGLLLLDGFLMWQASTLSPLVPIHGWIRTGLFCLAAGTATLGIGLFISKSFKMGLGLIFLGTFLFVLFDENLLQNLRYFL